MTKIILKKIDISSFDLILLPGFVQWDTKNLEKEFLINIKKGPEFASDLPVIIKNINNIQLSSEIPANRLLEISGDAEYKDILKEHLNQAKEKLGSHTFYINDARSDLMIGRNLPPPIIAEIVNCTEKSDRSILKKVKHYIDSGADIIDIGCVANKSNPEKVKDIIKLIRSNFDILISVDSMDVKEIRTAVSQGIDIILSMDLGSYNAFLDIPKNIPIVILPSNIKEGYFPREPETRVGNLIQLTKKLKSHGFEKLIADPILESPISPGICNSLEAYFLYKKIITNQTSKDLELPLFFGISNVVELMDIDSVGINGLLASIAIELGIGILFTVEHSPKLMGGVSELKDSVKLNYISKYRNSPPINQGIQIFKAKGKTNQEVMKFDRRQAIVISKPNPDYIADDKGYFKVYINHYYKEIYVLFFSTEHKLLKTLIGKNAEGLCKTIIELKLTDNLFHINYIGRELSKAELCLLSGKPYIQDSTI
jgi:dihydropteroate synthase-like protein